jgi:hypothetical protein
MTEREKIYVEGCEALMEWIKCAPKPENGAVAVCVNALSKHIREVLGMWTEPAQSSPDQKCYLIGLTFADLIQLQNGGTIEVNPKNAGLLDLPTTIFLGGTEEHMAKGLAKHPDATYKFTDSHGDAKN